MSDIEIVIHQPEPVTKPLKIYHVIGDIISAQIVAHDSEEAIMMYRRDYKTEPVRVIEVH